MYRSACFGYRTCSVVHQLTYCGDRIKVLNVLREIEPEAVEGRKNRKFQKRIFYSEGVNKFWCMDQHDKWKKFGLRLHVCLEPVFGKGYVAEDMVDQFQPSNRPEVLLDTARELGCTYN